MKKIKKVLLFILGTLLTLFIGVTIWFQVYTSELSPLKESINQRKTGSIVNPGYFFTKFYYFISGTIRDARYRDFVSSLNLDANYKIMNFGCGPGAEAKYIAEVLSTGNGQLTCFDISQTWIDVAKIRLKNYTNIEFVCGDITAVELTEDSYDAIVIHYVLHDIPTDIRQKVIDALKKILKPEAKIFILEPAGKEHGIQAEEIKQLMTLSGFTLVESVEINYTIGANVNSQIYQKK